MELPNKRYQIIYADPAWSYENKSLNRGGAARHYVTMSDEDIYNLPISNLAENDAVLFLWTTFPKLQAGLDTVKAWGFEYKTCAFVWVKENKKAKSWFWGMGRWTRSNAEIVLLATRGGGGERIALIRNEIWRTSLRQREPRRRRTMSVPPPRRPDWSATQARSGNPRPPRSARCSQ